VGNFVALVPAERPNRDRRIWITALDVTIWDEGHNLGRTFYSNDLKGSVSAGKAEVSKRMIPSDRLADVEDVWDELHEVLLAIAAAAVPAPTDESSSPVPVSPTPTEETP
jgi:hypothetical protein